MQVKQRAVSAALAMLYGCRASTGFATDAAVRVLRVCAFRRLPSATPFAVAPWSASTSDFSRCTSASRVHTRSAF